MTPDQPEPPEDQDLAEVFDETMTTRDGRDIAHPDMAQGVFDATARAEDAEESESDDDAESASEDETELDVMLGRDDGVDEEAAPSIDPEDLVSTQDDSPADFESARLPEADEAPSSQRPSQDAKIRREDRLDEGLKETFPASDPVSINPGAD
ncbi:MAG: hypothetical protein ACRED9_02615 [Caulobacteraceae bacterium]